MGQFQIQLSQEGFSCASAVNIDPEYPREGDPCCSSALSRDVRGNVHGSVPDGSSDHACCAGNEDGVGFGIGTDVTLHVYMSLGLWYVMQGDGTTISLTELCFSLTSRNVWISVFLGDCQQGRPEVCFGRFSGRSRLSFETQFDTIYFILVRRKYQWTESSSSYWRVMRKGHGNNTVTNYHFITRLPQKKVGISSNHSSCRTGHRYMSRTCRGPS